MERGRGRARTRAGGRAGARAVGARAVVLLALAAVGAVGCSDDGDGSASTTTAAPTTDAPTTEATTTTTEPPAALVEITPTTTEAPATTAAPDATAPPDAPPDAPPPTEPPPPARVFELDWSALRLPTWFEYDDETNPDDPFWYIHNQAEEGFFFSLEMYTTGFGTAWTGETGTFELSCTEGGSGICIHLDPDGEGEDEVDLNLDFTATGTIEITTLDEEDGYDLTLTGVTFSDGTTIPGPTRLTGP